MTAVAVVQHFLLVFDHKLARLVHEKDFGTNSDAAVRAYSEMERKYRDEPNMDILLVGSDSIETVRLTHANYFDGTASVSKYLVGI